MKILSLSTAFGSDEARAYNFPSGVSYYRQLRPFKALGWEVNFWKIPFETEENIDNLLVKTISEYDVVVTKHIDNPMVITKLLAVCAFTDKPLVVDFDDHLFVDDGKVGGENQYYKQNTEHRSMVELLATEASAITVSVPALVDVYKRLNPNIFVVPNLCFKEDWKFPKKSQEDGRPTVGWAGTGSHAADHGILTNVMKRVYEKHKDVVFSFIGHVSPYDTGWIQIPRHAWSVYNPLTYWEGNGTCWPEHLANQGYDIGLAPLVESQTNDCRSLSKWFEYTMTDTPTVASNVGPYKGLYHQTDALLCVTEDDWVENINSLLENPDLRQTYVNNAKHRIEREFSSPTAWEQVYRDIAGRGFKQSVSQG